MSFVFKLITKNPRLDLSHSSKIQNSTSPYKVNLKIGYSSPVKCIKNNVGYLLVLLLSIKDYVKVHK